MTVIVVVAAMAALVHPWAVPGIVAGVVGLLMVWFWTKKVYLAFLFALPFSVEVAVGGGFKMDFPTEAIIPVILVVVLIRSVQRGKLCALNTRVCIPLLFYAGYFLVTLASTRFPVVAVKAILRDWTHIIGGFFLAIFLIRDRYEVERLLRWAALSTGALAVYGMLTQLIQGVAIYQVIAPPFFHEHSIPAAFLSFLLVLVLGLIFAGFARSQWIRFVYVPLLVLALALSFVRGAWLALGIGTLVVLWVFRRRIPVHLGAVSGLAMGLLVAAALGFGITDLFAQRMHHFADPEYVTNLDRIDRWGSAVSIWREHPLVGAGWGTYADEYFDHVFIHRAFSSNLRMGAHNLYLEILADGGLIGLLLFLVVIGVFFLEVRRVYRKVRGDRLAEGLCVGAAAAVSSYLLHAMVNNLGPSDKMAVLFWFTLALVPVAEHLWENRHHPYGKPFPSPAD
jgi:putative inorganic carbon (HCO3(-)) transporter